MPTVVASYQLLVVLVLQQADTATDFTDLGRKMLGGFVLAIVVAVTFTLLKIRWRDKNPPAKFISVIPSRGTDKQSDTIGEQ